MLTASSIPPEKVEALKERGQELPRGVVEIMARNLGPDSAPASVLKELDEHEPKGFVGHVLLDPDDDALLILWEPKVLRGSEE